eukprot:250861_1
MAQHFVRMHETNTRYTSTVVHTNRDAPEDKQLLHKFTLICNLYWSFNLFTQIAELLDFVCHVWITCDAIVIRHKGVFCGLFILLASSISCKRFLFHLNHPLYFLFNNHPSKYSKQSRIRLIQLWYRYHDIVENFFGKARRSTNATKNFGYLNIRILATVFVEDFGQPTPPFPRFAVHEILESIPHLIFLFIYVTYYQINSTLYTSSILLSVTCIACQILNFLATTNNIHYSILSARFLCIVIDIFGMLSFIASGMACLPASHGDILHSICYMFEIKFILFTLPLSCGLSSLFVLRSTAINPTLSCWCVDVLLFVLGTLISSCAFELCFSFYWMGLVIHRLYNQRFSYWDGNGNFWRRIIEWSLTDIEPIIKHKHSDPQIRHELMHRQRTNDTVMRLFSVNTNLCASIGKFSDTSLKEWMDDVYKVIFYTYYGSEYKIRLMDFNKHSETNVECKLDIFKLIINEQVSSYFRGHNQSTTTDIIQYMANKVQLLPFVAYFVDRNGLERACECMFECIMYFVLWIAAPLYLISRVLNVMLPFIILSVVDDIAWNGCLFAVTLCYGLSILALVVSWFVNINVCGYGYIRCGSDVSSLIYSLCPSMYRQGQLYVSLKYGYFTQHELFERIKWHYDRHKYAQIEGNPVVETFGKDIARAIFDFFPRSYSEEKLCNA